MDRTKWDGLIDRFIFDLSILIFSEEIWMLGKM